MKKPIAILMQFDYKGRKETYKIDFPDEYKWGYKDAIAFFKIYERGNKRKSLKDRLLYFFFPNKYRKMLSNEVTPSQSVPITH